MRRGLALAAALLALLACGDDAPREETLSSALFAATSRRALAGGDCAGAVAPISSGFGAPGPYAVERRSFPNPAYPSQRVTVFLPVGAKGRVPALLFAHANGVDDPDAYRGLLEHLVGRGLAVVFSPYMIGAKRLDERYDALWAGFAEAARREAKRLDLSRLGFVGHSFGAGALPWLARRAARAGWASQGALLLSMAPWYALRAQDDGPLPAHLAALVLVFADDQVNDHRIAIHLFHELPLPEAQKDYLVVRSERSGACELPARHTLPQSRGLRARDDALDVWALFRLADALAAWAFEGDPNGRLVALGHGTEEQVAMGHWSDGHPLQPLLWSPTPQPSHAEAHYLFKWSDAAAWEAWEAPGPGGLTPAGATPGP